METKYTDPQSYYKHLGLFWTDLFHLMSSKPVSLFSVGPMRNFASNAKKISIELLDSNEKLIEFNKNLAEYYKQLTDTWMEAQKKVNTKAPDLPNDSEQYEAYKRVWMDIFENDFTALFDSKEFGENYGKMVSKELELTKHWNNITNVLLHSANLPNKNEIDDVYKQLHDLKRKVSKLESEINSQKRNDTDGK